MYSNRFCILESFNVNKTFLEKNKKKLRIIHNIAIRNVNEITSKTDWIIGHAHMALFGAFTFFAIGGVYYVIPAITKKKLWSKSLADWHFSLSLLGGLIYFVTMWVGGFYQGMRWADWANGTTYAEFHNNITSVPFLQTVADMWYWWLFRGIGGILIFLGSLSFLLNIFNTIVLEPRDENNEISNLEA